eukprot:357012-Chlamydomonas_euryale.AAC.4
MEYPHVRQVSGAPTHVRMHACAAMSGNPSQTSKPGDFDLPTLPLTCPPRECRGCAPCRRGCVR